MSCFCQHRKSWKLIWWGPGSENSEQSQTQRGAGPVSDLTEQNLQFNQSVSTYFFVSGEFTYTLHWSTEKKIMMKGGILLSDEWKVEILGRHDVVMTNKNTLLEICFVMREKTG